MSDGNWKAAFLALPLVAMLSVPVGAGAVDNAGPETQYKLPRTTISDDLTAARKTVNVLDSRMAYLELGDGEPVVFVHGNPTSSYLWRNVMPHISGKAKGFAVDLIGMGESGKPDIGYTFADHYRYFAGFMDAMNLQNVTLVGHDWGAAIVWEYARRNPGRVKRLAFMEGVLPPTFPQPTFEAMGEEMGGMFRAFKNPEQGHKMVIEDNMFIEKVLPGFVNRPMSDAEMAAYRKPFTDPAARKPVLAWPREVPIEGQPASTVKALSEIESFMVKTKMPVLLAYADPGVLIPPKAVGWYVERIANLESVYVGQGLHFIQEDQPDAIGRALADWMRRN